MIAVGARIPAARVWTTPNEDATLEEIARETGPILLLFYLFDWSST